MWIRPNAKADSIKIDSDKVTVNDGTNNCDFEMLAEDGNVMMYMDSSENRVRINSDLTVSDVNYVSQVVI